MRQLKNWYSRFEQHRSDKRPRRSRAWKWALAALLGLYALYVGIATAFICLSGMTWVTQSEEDIRIDVVRGYSLFPGRFHLTDVRVQFKDYNVEMWIFAEEADLSIALHRLLKKQIHLHWVRASGVEFRTFHRVQDRKKNAARLALFPDIPAFDRPPYYDAPRPPRSDKKPWSLRVNSIEAEAHTVWVMEFQLRGKIRGTGAFYTDPEHEAEVLPCSAEVSAGTISVGQEQVASKVQGTLAFALSPFTVRDAPIEKVLPKISAQVKDFSARIDTLSFTKLYVSTEPVRLEGGGALEMNTAVVHGRIQPGSTASLSLSPMVISAQNKSDTKNALSAQGRSQLSFQAAAGGQMEVAVHAQFPPGHKGAFSAEHLNARAALHQSDVTQLDVRGIQVDVKSLRYERPDFLHALLGKSPAIPMSGTFHLQGKADLPEKGASGLEARIETISASFYFEGQRLGATTETTLSCKGTLESAQCGVDFHAPYLLVDRKPDSQAVALWLRLKTQGSLQTSAARGTFEGPLIVSGGDPKQALSEWMSDAWLPQMGLKLIPTGPITGSLRIRRTPGQLSLTEIDITTGKTQLEGELISNKTIRAVGTIKMPSGRWGFEATPNGVSVRPFVGEKWLEKQ